MSKKPIHKPKQGDVVLVPFPFTDLTEAKVRPAIVVHKKAIGNDTIVVFVSSVQKKTNNSIALTPTKQNGLHTSSVVVVNKLATLSNNIIIGKIGAVSASQQNQISKAIVGLF